MKETTSEQIRNVALTGHQGAGKTSLVEALLFNTGAINRLGRVEEGNTVSDWDDDEKERGLSLSTSLVPVEFNEVKINLLDTPGYTDFQGEVKNAVTVADSVVVVVDAVAGVEVGTELAWEYAQASRQPLMVVINKLDRDNASFEGALDSLKAGFPGYKFIPVMLPVGAQDAFTGVVNLLTRKAYYGAGAERAELPEELEEAVEAARLELVEAAAEADDALIEKYFEEGDLSDEEIRDGMRKAARDPELQTVPVFATSATGNIGTVPLLEALVAYAPPPGGRMVPLEGEDAPQLRSTQENDAPLAAWVFKSINDRYVGTLSFFRIYSGSVQADTRYYNSTRRSEERFGPLIVMRGKEQFNVPVLHCGDIGVVSRLSDTRTGDTITTKEADLQIVSPELPAPLYMVAVTPRTQADGTRMGSALSNLAGSDPTLRWRHDSDTRQTLLEGMGEAHVKLALSRAERLGVNLDMGLPRVPYKETITRSSEVTYRHKKQTGGAGQFAEISMRLEPNAGKGYEYEAKIFGGAISNSFLPSIDKGIQSVLPEGVIAGFPVVDVKAVVFDGKEHPVDSKDIAFQIAGREGFREAFGEAAPVLQEPIMDVRIVVPEALMGDILGDLNSRRGRVQGMESEGNKSIVSAQVPLAEMIRYGNDLRSMSGGRGMYTMTFARYEQVPTHLAGGVIAAARREAEESQAAR